MRGVGAAVARPRRLGREGASLPRAQHGSAAGFEPRQRALRGGSPRDMKLNHGRNASEEDSAACMLIVLCSNSAQRLEWRTLAMIAHAVL